MWSTMYICVCVLYTCVCLLGIDAQPHHQLDLGVQSCSSRLGNSTADILRNEVSGIPLEGDGNALGCQYHPHTAASFLNIWAGRENKTKSGAVLWESKQQGRLLLYLHLQSEKLQRLTQDCHTISST